MKKCNERLNEQLMNVLWDEKATPQIRLKKAKYLVELGADVNSLLFGKSAVSVAISNNDEELVQYLKDKGGKEWEISKDESIKLGKGLLRVLRTHDWKESCNLIKKGADLEVRNEKGETALIVASGDANAELMELLLKRNSQTLVCDNYKITPLIMAAWGGNKDAVEMLLKKDYDIEARDKEKKTALIRASWRGCIEVFEMLLEKGAKIDAKDDLGQTALMWGALRGYKDAVEFLLLRGAKMELKDNDGRTALMWGRVVEMKMWWNF